MRVLLFKMSSLGDIIHTYPALTDAQRAIPDIQFDWVVEEGFVDLPALHPAVDRVIPLPWRRLRQSLWKPGTWRTLRGIIRQFNDVEYDLIIDAQGLIKSAFWSGFIRRVPVAGLNAQSAREPLAARWYHHRYDVPWGQHAISRVRQLFAQALHYEVPDLTVTDYGLKGQPLLMSATTFDAKKLVPLQPFWVLAHATTWDSKHWPEAYWHRVVMEAARLKRHIVLPWHSEEEKERCERLARLTQHVYLLPALGLSDMAQVLMQAELVIGVDTGLTHLSAALDVPVLAIYGSTEPGLTGVVGTHARILQADYACAPCLKPECIELSDIQSVPPCYERSLSPARIIDEIKQMVTL